MRYLNFIIVCFLLIPSISKGVVINVPKDYTTIQAAIDSATHGDEIIVSEGTYFENIQTNGQNIILRSIDPNNHNVVSNTIIDGASADTVVTFSGTELSSCTLSGFTITNGFVGDKGGGIDGNKCYATIQNNIIINNKSLGSGGGIFECYGTIERNIVQSNTANYGGGLIDCEGTIKNNIILDNTSYYGGGIYSCPRDILNNTIYNNSPYGLRECGHWGVIMNCIVWENYNTEQISQSYHYTYCCIQNFTEGGTGNIITNPNFVDPIAGNFHLNPNSPCIDAGGFNAKINQDFEGNSRPYDSTDEDRGDNSNFDIGAYEFIGTASINHSPDRPFNIYPVNSIQILDASFNIVSSTFSDQDSDNYHIASHWQIDNNSDFSSPEYDSDRDFTNKTSTSFPPSILYPSTIYRWRVRYLDNLYKWSDWSVPTTFIIRSVTTMNIPDDYSTIQSAIDVSFNGDEIVVSPGTYYENLYTYGKNIILRSTDPTNPTIIAETIIDGASIGSVITFEGTESSDCLLSGFTITHGFENHGSAINGSGYEEYPSNDGTLATIRYNVVSDNNRGTAVFNCDGLIENNIISNNSAENYTAIGACDGVIQNNEIFENTADISAAGVCGCNGIIQNNLIYKNISGTCGGIFMCKATIQNNTVYNNKGRGIYDCEGIVRNCIVWGNTSILGQISVGDNCEISYCCIEGWTEGARGNISDDPGFVDPLNYDFHLSFDSPCIDSGGIVYNIPIDYEGNFRPMNGSADEPRGDGSEFDIGAYEYEGYVYPSITPIPTNTLPPTNSATPTPTPPSVPTISPDSNYQAPFRY